MDKHVSREHELHMIIESMLRDRIMRVHDKGNACSLLQAMMDLELAQYCQHFHTLIEAIEDAEAL